MYHCNKQEYVDKLRAKVLNALDEFAEEMFGKNHCWGVESKIGKGARDIDLPELFRTVDRHGVRLADRYGCFLVDTPNPPET